MKTLVRFIFLINVFVFSSTVLGQISNLLVNGSSTYFTMVSGGQISWSYNLPIGGTAQIEIWIDVNSNTVIDPGTDVFWQSFYQIDGQYNLNGPPDMDSLVNGHIIFAQDVGLAPGEYIMSFSNNNSAVTIPGTVTPLTSPVFTISGSVTVPVGQSAQYLVINFGNSGQGNNKFWNAITDVSGNYSVQMDADTSGNPWELSIDNAFLLSPAVVSPDRISINLDAGVATNYPGNDFTFTEAAAEVRGTVIDDDGNLLQGIGVWVSGNNGNFNRNVQTNSAGEFRIGFLLSELPASNVWLGAGDSEDISIVAASTQLPTVFPGNIITKNLTIYWTNSTITGNVTLEGNPPNMNIEMSASIIDTGHVVTFTDLDGNYTLHVSDKLFNYYIGPGYLPPNYIIYFITAHPGQTNVNFNFTVTDVEQDQSVIPTEFSLNQNFPNPFNSSSVIKYSIPKSSQVSLKIFNALGQELETLVNEEKPVGVYEVNWNAANLPSGVYFYQLRATPNGGQAGAFTETRKMILLR